MEVVNQILSGLGNHFRLTWRLMVDKRVQILSKAIVVLLPLLYVLYPKDAFDDFYPLIGLLDDMIIFGFSLCTIFFKASGVACPLVWILYHKTPLPFIYFLKLLTHGSSRYPSHTE